MIPTQHSSAALTKQAAMFIDFENLHTILKLQSEASSSTIDYAHEIFDEVRRYLEEGDDTPTIFARAYGVFDTPTDEEDVQIPSALHQRGIEPVHVPDAMQDNTAEVRLTIDLTHFLAQGPAVETVVIVTGNRPYLPLVRWIREQGHRALVAAVNPPQTSDTPSFEEDSQYLDARNLLSQDSREALLANAPENGAAYTRAKSPSNPPPQQYQSLSNPVARRAIEITEEHFGQYDEVYLTPLLRKLSDILGSDHDPKSLVSDLEAAGAARLEKRNGYPYNYTVLIMNDDHPDVRDIREQQNGVAPQTSDASPEDPSPVDTEPSVETDPVDSAHSNPSDGHEADGEHDSPAEEEARASEQDPDPTSLDPTT